MLGFQRVHGVLMISDSSDPSCVSYTQVAVVCVKCHVELRTQFHNHDDRIWEATLLLVARIYLNFATVTAFEPDCMESTNGRSDSRRHPRRVTWLHWFYTVVEEWAQPDES